MTLLTVERLSKRFPIHSGAWRHVTGNVQALIRVSFALEAGKTLAVVGGSGSGKTTLARILCGLLTADEGEIRFSSGNDDKEGRPMQSFTRAEWARRIQMVFQDPYASLNPKLSIELQLSEALRVAGSGAQTAADLLKQVDLPADALHRYPFQFSGGQRQRIAIARALALNPRLLILDEPLSALDLSTQDQIIALFQDVQKRNGLAYLLITHDLSLAAQLADRVLVLQEGRLVEEGPAKQVLTAPQHAYTQALVEAVL